MKKRFFLKQLFSVFVISSLFGGALLADGAGVIPVCTDRNGTIKFLLGREKFKGLYEGFGGDQERKDGKSLLETAKREFNEETGEYFQDQLRRIGSSPYIQRPNRGSQYRSYFWEARCKEEWKINKAINRNRHKSRGHDEVLDVKWLTRQELERLYDPDRKKTKLSHRTYGQLWRAGVMGWYGLRGIFGKQETRLRRGDVAGGNPQNQKYIEQRPQKSQFYSPPQRQVPPQVPQQVTPYTYQPQPQPQPQQRERELQEQRLWQELNQVQSQIRQYEQALQNLRQRERFLQQQIRGGYQGQ